MRAMPVDQEEEPAAPAQVKQVLPLVGCKTLPSSRRPIPVEAVWRHLKNDVEAGALTQDPEHLAWSRVLVEGLSMTSYVRLCLSWSRETQQQQRRASLKPTGKPSLTFGGGKPHPAGSVEPLNGAGLCPGRLRLKEVVVRESLQPQAPSSSLERLKGVGLALSKQEPVVRESL
jgi:hypothetical protein